MEQVMDEREPTCDICGKQWADRYDEPNDWNGETGSHLSCEALRYYPVPAEEEAE